MVMPKLVIKVEDEQKNEVFQLHIPAKNAALFLILVGQQSANCCPTLPSPKHRKQKFSGKRQLTRR